MIFIFEISSREIPTVHYLLQVRAEESIGSNVNVSLG